MKKVFVIYLFCIVGLAYGQRVTLGDKVKQDEQLTSFYFMEGVKSYVTGNFKGANEIFESIEKMTSGQHAPSLYYQSRLAMQRRESPKALEKIQQALAVDSLNVDYLELYARLAVDANKLDEALAVYNKLSIIDTFSTENKIFLPILTYLKGDTKKAVEMIDSFEAKYGFEERLYALKREYLIENELYDQLTQYTDRVLASDPTNIEILIHTAQVNASHNRDSVALSYYNRAIEIGGAEIAPYIALADFYKIRKNSSEFAKVLPQILSSEVVLPKYKMDSFLMLFQLTVPEVIKSGIYDDLAKKLIESAANDVEIVKLYAEYLLYKNDMVGATDFLDNLYHKGELKEELGLLFVQILYQSKREKEATDIAYTLTKKWPKNMELCGISAHLFTLAKDTKKALEVLFGAIKNADTDSLKSIAYGSRGDFYYQLKKPSKYYADYHRALELDPNNAMVLNNLAYFMALDGKDLNQALVYSKRANEISEQNATYLDTQAWVNFLLGRSDEAKRLMQLAFAYERNPSFDMYLHYGDILYALGEDYLARENWNKALKAGADEEEVAQRLAKPKAVK